MVCGTPKAAVLQRLLSSQPELLVFGLMLHATIDVNPAFSAAATAFSIQSVLAMQSASRKPSISPRAMAAPLFLAAAGPWLISRVTRTNGNSSAIAAQECSKEF